MDKEEHFCWGYSECEVCKKKTYCTTKCEEFWCDLPGYCEHKYCKSFNRCLDCKMDICDECWIEREICIHCEYERKKLKWFFTR